MNVDAPPSSAPGTAALTARGIEVGYRDRCVISDLDLEIPAGAVTSVIGPNGCGKSTLLKALCRLLPLRAGEVTVDGTPLSRVPSRTLARKMGFLPQNPVAPEGVLVADLVVLGRHPHRSWIRQWAADDDEVVREALELTGVVDLADRPVDALSGGQRQRVWLSMALAQQTDILLLDEPTTYLDLAHSLDVLDLIDSLQAGHGRTVVMVLHDLALACRYSDNLVVMQHGAVVAQGDPADIITEELLDSVFGLNARILADPVSDRPLIVPVGRRRLHASD